TVEAGEPAAAVGPHTGLKREAFVALLLVPDEFVGNVRKGASGPFVFDAFLQAHALFVSQVDGRGGVEDDGERVQVTLGEERREHLDVVALHEPRWVGAHDLDGEAYSFKALCLVSPDERLEEAGPMVGRYI